MQKVKDAYDYYYRYKTKDEIAILFKKIVVVLRKTPVSMKDDVNHKIRKYVKLYGILIIAVASR